MIESSQHGWMFWWQCCTHVLRKPPFVGELSRGASAVRTSERYVTMLASSVALQLPDSHGEQGSWKMLAICQLSSRSCVMKNGVLMYGSVYCAMKHFHSSSVSAYAARQPSFTEPATVTFCRHARVAGGGPGTGRMADGGREYQY